MPLELSNLPVSFVMRAKFSGEPYSSLVDSGDFLEARNRALEICVDEDRYFISQREKRDVGNGFAEEHFMDNYFPGFDDGFAAAYQYRKPKDYEGKSNPDCLDASFFSLQIHEMRDFLRRYRKYEQERFQREVTLEGAFDDFVSTYFHGWVIGFKVGYCGLSCGRREKCVVGGKYIVPILDYSNLTRSEEEWMREVHGGSENVVEPSEQ
jgi:hypothetical protein